MSKKLIYVLSAARIGYTHTHTHTICVYIYIYIYISCSSFAVSFKIMLPAVFSYKIKSQQMTIQHITICILLLVRCKSHPDDDPIGSKHVAQ